MACAAGGRGGTLPLCRSLVRISDSKKMRLLKSSVGEEKKRKQNQKIEQNQGVEKAAEGFGSAALRASSQGSWPELI